MSDAAPFRTKPLNGDTTSQRIVIEARRNFLAHGFRRVTMDELSGELGMSKKTLYACFATKRALLEAVIDDKLRAVEADLARVAERSATDFPAALQELLVCVRNHADELKPVFLRDLTRDAPELYDTVQTRRRNLLQQHFGKLLGEGRKNGMVRTDINPSLMIEILLGATNALMTPGTLAELGLSAKTCMTGIISVFLRGVMTDKARQCL